MNPANALGDYYRVPFYLLSRSRPACRRSFNAWFRTKPPVSARFDRAIGKRWWGRRFAPLPHPTLAATTMALAWRVCSVGAGRERRSRSPHLRSASWCKQRPRRL